MVFGMFLEKREQMDFMCSDEEYYKAEECEDTRINNIYKSITW